MNALISEPASTVMPSHTWLVAPELRARRLDVAHPLSTIISSPVTPMEVALAGVIALMGVRAELIAVRVFDRYSAHKEADAGLVQLERNHHVDFRLWLADLETWI